MRMDLTRPCANCPFRKDVVPFLRRSRIEELEDGLHYRDQTFTCHKTLEYDDEGESGPNKKEQHCAGALILLEKYDNPNQMMRIYERVGMYDRTKLAMDAPVFDSWEEMADHHAQSERR